MKLPFALLICAAAMLVEASAWAILLSAPELYVPAGVDRVAVHDIEDSLAKLKFESGMIHVNSSSRSLRFKSPGQELIKLIPALQDAGFKVAIRFSDKMPERTGFTMSQNEVGDATITVVINSRHPKLDLKMLA